MMHADLLCHIKELNGVFKQSSYSTNLLKKVIEYFDLISIVFSICSIVYFSILLDCDPIKSSIRAFV